MRLNPCQRAPTQLHQTGPPVEQRKLVIILINKALEIVQRQEDNLPMDHKTRVQYVSVILRPEINYGERIFDSRKPICS
jgi:hypothetical protein